MVMIFAGGQISALVCTVLNVATAPATSGNSLYGLAIGFAVFAQAVAVGKVSWRARHLWLPAYELDRTPARPSNHRTLILTN